MEIVPIVVCLLLAVLSFCLAYKQVGKDQFIDTKKESDCVQSLCGSDDKCCVLWTDGVCRKGHIEGKMCVAKGDVMPLIFLALGVVFLISVFFFVFRSHNTQSKESFYYF